MRISDWSSDVCSSDLKSHQDLSGQSQYWRWRPERPHGGRNELMNAPWRPAGAALRDPFNAFVCDDSSFDLVRSICVEMGWPPEKVHKGGLRNAVQSDRKGTRLNSSH